MKRFIFTLLTAAISGLTFGQIQNTIAITIEGNSGVDQTVIRFDEYGSSSFDQGPDMEKVFPSDINNPTIFTCDADSVIYSINAMPEGTLVDTMVPVYIQNAIAENYQISISDIAPLSEGIQAYIVVPSTNDTIAYSGNEDFVLSLNPSASFNPTAPAFIIRFGVDYDLALVSVQESNVSCAGFADGSLQIDSPLENVEISLYDQDMNQVGHCFSQSEQTIMSSLTAGMYTLKLTKGISTVQMEVQIGTENNEEFEITVVSENNSDLSVQMEVNNPVFETVNWDLGDNATSDQRIVSHTYQNNGVYNVVMTVENLGCVYTDSVQIDFTSVSGVQDEQGQQDIRFHYSKRNGLKLFKDQDQIEAYTFYGFDGRIIESGNADFSNFHYLGSHVILKYKTQVGKDWKTLKLVAMD